MNDHDREPVIDLDAVERQTHRVRVATPSRFTPGDYSRGRALTWQVSWHLVQNLVFKKWWLPDRFRSTILRAFGADVGTGVRVREGVYVHWPWRLKVGPNAQIGRGVSIYNLVEVTIGEEAVISQEAFITSGSHRSRSETFAYDNRPTEIGSGAWVGARALILAGSTVGVDAVVAAGNTLSGRLTNNTISVATAQPRLSNRFPDADHRTNDIEVSVSDE